MAYILKYSPLSPTCNQIIKFNMIGFMLWPIQDYYKINHVRVKHATQEKGQY